MTGDGFDKGMGPSEEERRDSHQESSKNEDHGTVDDDTADDEIFYDAGANATDDDDTSKNSSTFDKNTTSPIKSTTNTRGKRRISKPARYDNDANASLMEKRLRKDKIEKVVQDIVDKMICADYVVAGNVDRDSEIVHTNVSTSDKKILIYKILYIDDNIDEKASSDILQQSISRISDDNKEIICAIDCASNAFTALEMTECIAYDAIFTNLNLSGINSIDILNILRRVGCPVPIVLVYPDSEYEKVSDSTHHRQLQENYQKLGFFRVLFKPFSVITLNNMFQALVQHNLSPSHLRTVETYVNAHKDISL